MPFAALLFAGSEAGGQRAAQFYTLIETAKLNDINPHDYLKHILTALPSAKAKDLDALLPWNYHPQPRPEVVICSALHALSSSVTCSYAYEQPVRSVR